MVTPRSWIEVDRARLLSNLGAFRRLLQPGTALMAVVKANAYGHGLDVVAPVVAPVTDWFGVDSLDEALVLAKLGLGKPVLILGYTPADASDDVVRNGFSQVLYRPDAAAALSDAASRLGLPARVHLKVETGTHRQGVSPADLALFVQDLVALPGIEVEGVYTHFANIEDTLDPSYAELQLTRFRQALAVLAQNGIHPPCVHAAATAGILLYPETHFALVRLGMGAYGIWPSRETQLAARERGIVLSLAPALAWKSRIAQLKTLTAGDYVGYGLTFQAARPTTIAVVPVGYYDGYDRKLSNGGRAIVNGRMASVVGRIAMNMLALDVTEAAPPLDATVVLLGREGSLEVRAEELAERAGTIPYEILSRINPLLPRLIV